MLARPAPLLSRLRHDVLAVLGVLAILIASQVLGELHLVRQHHAVCAAHGELIEGADDHDSVESAAPPSAGGGAVLELVFAPAAHHHCVVASTLHSASRHSVVRGLEARLAPVCSLPTCESSAPQRSIAILHLAPKLSPPRA